jgi:uncharacterized membrane protein (DUF373 family)
VRGCEFLSVTTQNKTVISFQKIAITLLAARGVVLTHLLCHFMTFPPCLYNVSSSVSGFLNLVIFLDLYRVIQEERSIF